nr:GpE family phage tail protein [Rhodothalassium salexigens]
MSMTFHTGLDALATMELDEVLAWHDLALAHAAARRPA